MKAGIYLITSPSGSRYVGQAVNLGKRMNEYKSLHCKNQTYLLNSLKKYGFEQHKITFLFECNFDDFEREVLKDLLNNLETEFILVYKTFIDYDPKGMNLTTGGGVCVISEQTRAKLSARQIGKTHSEQTRARMSKPKSEQGKANIKEANNRPEVRAKRSESAKIAQNRPEVRVRKSEFQNRPEVRARNSEFHKEYQNRPEVKARRSEANKGDKNPSHIAKIKRYNEKLQRLRERKDLNEPLNVPKIIGVQKTIF